MQRAYKVIGGNLHSIAFRETLGSSGFGASSSIAATGVGERFALTVFIGEGLPRGMYGH